MINEIRKQLPGYEITPISRQNFAQAFEVYESNQDFFILTQGKKATIETSINDITAIPPNCDISQKVYVSIWDDSQVIGVLDVITGFPKPNHIWIGLLLIHGKLHGKSIGSEVVSALLKAAKTAGYEDAPLGVIENNKKGIAFWQKHGFKETRTSGNIVVMEIHL